MDLTTLLKPWSLYLMMLTTLMLLSDVDCLQCFQCRGVSYYDPDSCFYPMRGKTVRQECQRGEVCETRVHRDESIETVIERGCTNACNGRTFVWTDYFQVYCCNTNECNSSRSLNYSLVSLLFGLLSVLFHNLTHR